MSKAGSEHGKRPSPATRSRVHKWLPLLIVAAGAIVYLDSFAGVFLFDDDQYIVNNPYIQKLWPITDVLAHSRRPVVNLTLAINYAVGGLNTWGYHLVNLIIHLLAGLVLYGVVRRTLLREQFSEATRRGAPWLASCVALLWVVHPLQTQSVTYIIQRGETLMGLFYLLTIYCVIRAADSARPIGWYVAAIAACALGMGSKAVVITAPLVVLIYDRVFLTRSWRQMVRRRWGLYLGLAATWSVLLMCRVVQGVLAPPPNVDATVGFGYKGVTPLQYAATQPGVILHYLRLSLFPYPLCLDYDWPVADSVAAIVLPGVVIAALLAVTIWALLRKPWLGFPGACFFLILAPTSSFVPIRDLAFEHRMYLPLAAVATLAVIGGRWALRAVGLTPRRAGVVGCGLVCVAALLLSLGTILRNRDYHSDIGMWSDVTAKRPGNVRAHTNLATLLRRAGRLDEAITHCDRALQLDPDYAFAHNTLGLALADQGKIDEAITQFAEAVRIKPDYMPGHANLGAYLWRKKEYDRAYEQCTEALRLDPQYAPAYLNRAIILQSQGKLDAAMADLRRALALQPLNADVHYMLGVVLNRQGHVEQANHEFREALRLQPDHAPARDALEAVSSRQGQTPP